MSDAAPDVNAGTGGGAGGTGGASGTAGGIPDKGAGNSPAPPPGWTDIIKGVSDDGLRGGLEKYDSLESFAKAHNTLRGELNNRIRLPGEGASDSDIAKFREKMGVPADPKGYEFKAEGIEMSDADAAIIDRIKPIAHKHNVPAAAFNAMVGELLKDSQALQQQIETEIASAHGQAEAALKKKWGGDYDKNVELAKRAAQAHNAAGDEAFDFVSFLNSAKLENGGLLGDHPVMINYLATIGRKTDESELGIATAGAERQSAQQELDAIYAKTPPGSPGYLAPAVQKRVAELFTIIAGSGSIVGAGGRTS